MKKKYIQEKKKTTQTNFASFDWTSKYEIFYNIYGGTTKIMNCFIVGIRM
jgi:hypothetical protein